MKQLSFALFAAAVTAVFAFSLWWTFHNFVTGMPPFKGAACVLAVPVLVGLFMWGMRRLGKVAARRWGFGGYSPTMLFAMGFFVLMMYSFLLPEGHTYDIQVHDTYFVIANVHALRGVGILFGLAAAAYFFYARIVQRPLDAGLGYLHFWLTTVGFLLFFWAMDYVAQPRRFIEVRSEPSLWDGYGFSAITLAVLVAGQLVFLTNLVYSGLRGKRVK